MPEEKESSLKDNKDERYWARYIFWLQAFHSMTFNKNQFSNSENNNNDESSQACRSR